MELRKSVSGPVSLKQDGEKGLVQAVFCTFDVVDKDGDVVLKSGFTEGQKIKMMWAHDDARWIGDGTISTTAKEAIFTGEFWMDTQDGVEAFKKVKRASEKNLAEWSWAFAVPPGAAKYGPHNGDNVRYLGVTPLEIYEVSPVANGAGIDTRTTAIKSRFKRVAKTLALDPELLALIAQTDLLTDALDEIVDTLMDAAGIVDPDEDANDQDIPDAEDPLAMYAGLGKGRKVGRAIARTRRERIQAAIAAFRTATRDLEKLLAEADVPKTPAADDGKSARARALRFRALAGEARVRSGATV
jgi:phage head maturation protease